TDQTSSDAVPLTAFRFTVVPDETVAADVGVTCTMSPWSPATHPSAPDEAQTPLALRTSFPRLTGRKSLPVERRMVPPVPTASATPPPGPVPRSPAGRSDEGPIHAPPTWR